MSNDTYSICIVQLTRIGDIIQSYLAARQLKLENPNFKLTLVCREKFGKQLGFLTKEVFDTVHFVDTKSFFTKNTEPLKGPLKRINSKIEEINQTKYDLVVNQSFNKSSSYLTTMINAKNRMGIQRNNLGQVAVTDKWSQFIYSNVMNDDTTPFNLVDIYRHMLGVKDFTFKDNNVGHPNIVVHPFASHRKKRWGNAKWSELIYKLLKDVPGYTVTIVGGPEDIEDAKQIVSTQILKTYQDQIINLAGVTSIQDTHDLLGESALFIGHDSMVAHLAGITNIPSVILSLGTVRRHETSPYSPNSIILSPKNKCYPCKMSDKCDLLPCHNSLNYQAVFALCSSILNQEEISYENLTSKLSVFHIDNMEISIPSFDGFGIDLYEISRRDLNAKETMRLLYRVIWSFYLAGTEINSGIPMVTQQSAQTLKNIQQGLNYLFELNNYSQVFSNKIIDNVDGKAPNIELIQDNVAKLSEIDSLAAITKRTYPLLTGFIDFFYVNKANAPGKNIKEISQHNLLASHDATNLCSILNDLVDKISIPHMHMNIEQEKDL